MRKSKGVRAVFIIISAFVFFGAALFAVMKGYEKVEHEFRLATHPMKYSEYVEKYAEEYDIDKYVIYAFIKTESGFDPKAESDVGARGLMQLMETSFDWVKFRLGDSDDITYDDMYDPETNIRYGAYLVSYLIRHFGCMETAAAAYFSGIGTVDGWVSDPKISADGVHLDTIPGKGAAHYVDKINNAFNVYCELYANERK